MKHTITLLFKILAIKKKKKKRLHGIKQISTFHHNFFIKKQEPISWLVIRKHKQIWRLKLQEIYLISKKYRHKWAQYCHDCVIVIEKKLKFNRRFNCGPRFDTCVNGTLMLSICLCIFYSSSLIHHQNNILIYTHITLTQQLNSLTVYMHSD